VKVLVHEVMFDASPMSNVNRLPRFIHMELAVVSVSLIVISIAVSVLLWNNILSTGSSLVTVIIPAPNASSEAVPAE